MRQERRIRDKYQSEKVREGRKPLISTYHICFQKKSQLFIIRNYLRAGQPIGLNTLDKVCEILGKQPGDIIGYKKD